MSDRRPIGVFDSGVGGLTVVAALRRHLPDESILYLGDTARLPYGTKSAETVARYSRRNIDFLIQRGVKAVVIACNTASALTLNGHGEEVPIWGVIEPGARAAVKAAGDEQIGILATESTVRSDAYGRAVRALRSRGEVLSQPCPLFVPLVEEGWFDDEIVEAVARRYLTPVLEAGARTLVLGCTHYPMLRPLLARVAEDIAGTEVQLVDSAESVAREVKGRLGALSLQRDGATPPVHHFCVTDHGERFRRIAHHLLHHFHTGGTPVDETIPLELVEV